MTVQPLFEVPSCVLFAHNEMNAAGGDPTLPPPGRLPATVRSASGTLPQRDATSKEAAKHLKWQEAPWQEAPWQEAPWQEAPWPAVAEDESGSPYREAFHQGATMVPRMLCTVERVPAGRLGENPDATAGGEPPLEPGKSSLGKASLRYAGTLRRHSCVPSTWAHRWLLSGR